MHIAIDAHLISDQESYRGAGVSNYSRQLLSALGALVQEGAADHQITAFVHARDLAVPGVTLARTRLPLEEPLARIAWEQTVLPVAAARCGAQVVHGLVNVLPLAAVQPGVVTVHDLSFVRTPERLPPLKRAYQTRLCAWSVARAAQVIAVSQQTADDLAAWLDIPPERITVVHNGVAASFVPGQATANAAFRREHKLPERYVLYLGTLEPRKNLEVLLQAFASWRDRAGTPGQDVALVLAGAKGWYYETIFATATRLGLAQQVIFPGFIPGQELPAWYQAAAVFVYPSIFEGFGLPVLEAMACGVPVLCSRTASLLEVAADAAVTFVPGDVEALAAALQAVLSQPALAAALSARGQQRAALFSWRRCAQETLSVYDRVIGHKH